MKKILLIVLLFIPFFIHAESCNDGEVTIESVTMEEKNNTVVELNQATSNDKTINLDLSMSKVGDKIKYKIMLKNDSDKDYEIDKNNLIKASDYVTYAVETEDGSLVLGAHATKEVYLIAEYKNEVRNEDLVDGQFVDNSSITVNLANKQKDSIVDAIKNPETRTMSCIVLVVIILAISVIGLLMLKRKKYAKYLLLVMGIVPLLPVITNAICKYEFKIESSVQLLKKYYPCTFLGDLVQGAEFTEGDYTYRYMQEVAGNNWVNIDLDGWGIRANSDQQTISSKICTTINDKPIVSASYMFHKKQGLREVDLSSFDTSHIVSMRNMFSYCTKLGTVDFTGIDTSNVVDMKDIFKHFGDDASSVELDLSMFDTSKITDFTEMFFYSGVNSESVKLNVSNWDTSNVTRMYDMFDQFGRHATSFEIIGLSDWDTSKVENMYGMFIGAGHEAQRFEIDLSNWNTSNVTALGSMFAAAGTEAEVWSVGDLSNWDLRKVGNLQSVFSNAGANADTWNSIGTLNLYATSYAEMFKNVKNANAVLNFRVSPTYPSSVNDIFLGAATGENGRIVVNRTNNLNYFSYIMSQKSPESNIVEGVILTD